MFYNKYTYCEGKQDAHYFVRSTFASAFTTISEKKPAISEGERELDASC